MSNAMSYATNVLFVSLHHRWRYFSKRGSISSYNISQCVKEKPGDQPPLLFSRHISQTLEKFIASGDDRVLDEHIPTTIKRRRNERVTAEEHAVITCVCWSV